jgi:hypothetical protein
MFELRPGTAAESMVSIEFSTAAGDSMDNPFVCQCVISGLVSKNR